MTEEQSALDAKYDAQKIAFAPIIFQVSRVLRDKGILTYIRKQRKVGADIPQIAKAVDVSEYGVRVLLEMGFMAGIVDRREGEIYTLTKVGYFIDSDELTRVNMDFTHDICYKGMFYLEESIDKGAPIGLKQLGDFPTIYEGLSHLEPKVLESWLAFDHYYSDGSFPVVMPIVFERQPKSFLDVGGNTGKFSIKCCEYNEDVHMTIVDLPGQIGMATKRVKEHALSDRISFYPCDMLELAKPLPKSDAIWMSQFLDCFSEDEIVSILKHTIKAMKPQSRLYIMETFWDKQEFPAASYSLAATSVYFTNIANGNSKMYGIRRFIALIEKSGLVVEKEHFPIGLSHTILTCKLPD